MGKPESWRLIPASYPILLDVQTRFQDLDPNGHLNNVAFAALFEHGRVRLNRDVRPMGERPGNSSWTIEQAMFQHGLCIATCDTVVVCRTDNAAQPLRAELREQLEKMLTTGS